MLNLNQSNRFEVLLQMLCENLAERPASVFTPDQVIVPSAAVKRKLMLAIADVYGVCANVTFPFLAQWLWQQIGSLVVVGKTSPFSSSVLSWRILRFLEEPGFAKAYPRLAAYLARCDDVMRFDLACRVAALFERYVLYRPEWLEVWAGGEMADIVRHDHPRQAAARDDQAWQAALWRKIAEETGTLERDPVARFFSILDQDGEKAAARLPKRVHLFCEPSVAPQYIEMLRRLGKWVDIELYVINPCREYWFEIVDSRRLAWLANRQQDLYHETGNRLLASWGKQNRATLDLMLTQLEPFGRENDGFVSTAQAGQPETVLSHIQDAILDLAEPEPGSLSHLGEDGSMEIHVAHSLMREIEILHDQLLRRFASEDSPDPSDVLVVMPDLDEAAPMIEAVFSHSGSGTRIPYVITGRRNSHINPVARALLDVLSLASSRFSATGVMDVLMLPEIGTTFGFGDGLKTLRRWLDDAGICWALDGSHKEEFDLPPDDSHTFHDGLHRLFLAYALPDRKRLPVNGRLPAGHASGSRSPALGQLWRFVEAVRQLKRDLSLPRTPAGWMQCWCDVLDTFVTLTPETLDADREVRSRIARLHEIMAEASDTFETGFAIARHALERALEGAGEGSVPAGAVTFAPMDSLRGLPFDHVFAIGLNDGIYPADVRPEEFDLIQLAPRKNDRLLRDTDRNVFLDLVLSARKSLYLGYSGKNIRDNSVRPPSVLIAELLDVLVPAMAEGPDEKSLKTAYDRLVTEHPLQPFSTAYFDGKGGERLASFRSDLCAALNTGIGKIQSKEEIASKIPEKGFDDENDGDERIIHAGLPFFTKALHAPDESWRQVLLDDLIRFFRHPARYLLQRRLGIGFQGTEEDLPADEPFVVDRSARRKLADRLLPLYLENISPGEIGKAALAGNEFPSGHLGTDRLKSELMALGAYARSLSADLESGLAGPVGRTLEFDFEGEYWRLSGTLTGLRENGLVRYRYDNGSPWDFLDGWIRHLFLNACRPEGILCRSVWHFRDEKTELGPVEDAEERLRDLVAIYRTGLCRPLHFFPRPAWEYISNGHRLDKAADMWRESNDGENDVFNRLAMRGVDNPVDGEFADLAGRVFGPFFAHKTGETHEGE